METIVALMTPTGRSATAMLRLSGDSATTIAEKLFTGRLQDRRAVLGYVVNEKGEKLDHSLVTYFAGPASYTGEDVVEISLHGSPVLAQEVCRLCLAHGARMAGRGEFTRRAFLAGKLDMTAAEGVMELIDSRSPAEMRAAAAHLCGTVYQEMRQVRESLLSITARLYAYVDYPDDDIGDYPIEELLADLKQAETQAQELMRRAQTGQQVRDGADVCLCGAVNAGKSSLMNRLSQADRSIVTDIPGTTRDVVTHSIVLDDLRINLLDTAGLRDTDDPVERIGVEKSRKAVEQAAVILCLFDASRELSQEDLELIATVDKTRAVAVINKTDLEEKINKEYIKDNYKHFVEISAKTGQGMEQIKSKIKEMAFGGAVIDEGLIFSLRQADCIKQMAQAVEEAYLAAEAGVTYDAVGVLIDGAVAAAGEMTGESLTEDTVHAIFDRFCVGK
ncbi:MAG: tRNA uridine-5-carboxymethylaminomethyl(34) synthesis GTPase MnmE [Clostridia bacterium]|nr:tRNA uridine-5-carboxymethylaminomethyl(34) synthesis GTPase MnmE [Clostridia bacterium]